VRGKPSAKLRSFVKQSKPALGALDEEYVKYEQEI